MQTLGERELFDRCISLPAGERRAFLHDACGSDSQLEERVLRLLDAHDRAETFSPLPLPPALAHPEWIGPYGVLECIGEGGMGTVYAAEQTSPIRRRVALKVIKPGMDSREVIARFETERQVLALMNHPNIAAILDAGATEQGRPYFVMEYVPGEPLNEFCDKHRLSIRERIELFLSVCEGVQHAHQKGIIHRDLKPSNVLVTIEGDRAVPKVIDFGVAKATQLRIAGATVHTRLGSVIGTPEYMSPEQAEMTGLDIDTRSDVYSLGMILYELLVGALPFDADSLRTLPVAEIQRTIRETHPPRPSSRARGDDAAAVERAARRQLEPAAHRRMLQGDLDGIVMKSLDKARTRRYPSASGFASDLRRHLDGQPVVAGPDSVLYRALKFTARHRTPVAIGAVLVLLLAMYGITVTVQNRRIAVALEQAVMEADRTEQVTDFLVRIMESDVTGEDSTVRRVLSRAVDDAIAIQGQPGLRAQVFAALARVYRHNGEFGTAEHILQEAVEIERRAGSRNGAEARIGLGDVLRLRGRYDSAEVVLREALESEQAFLGQEHPRIARAMVELHLALRDAGRLDEAEQLIRDAQTMQRRLFAGDHPALAGSLNYLAAILRRRRLFDESRPLYHEALEMRRRLYAADHTSIAESLNNLALLATQTNDLPLADSLYGEANAMWVRLLGDNHPWVATGVLNRAAVWARTGRSEEAIGLARQALAIRQDVFGDTHGGVADAYQWLGILHRQIERFDLAESHGREAVAIMTSTSENPQRLANAMHNVARTLFARGDFVSATALMDSVADLYQDELGAHRLTAAALFDRGRAFEEAGVHDSAAELIGEALDMRRTVFGDTAAVVERTAQRLADLLAAQGRSGEADSVRALDLGGQR